MKRNFVVLAVMVVAITVMLWTGWRKSRTGAVAGANPALTGSVKGKVAPDFELKALDGKVVHLSDYRGQAVLLNFWATWCSPCKEEMPWFVDLQKQYGPEGLRVIGVAMDDAGPDAISKFSRDMGVNYTILLGTDKVADAYGGVEALPTTFYIGRDGRIIDRVFGLTSHRDVENNVKSSLRQPMAAAPVSSTSGAVVAGAHR